MNTSLNFQKRGFFVECGALDGDRSSNSLYLETELHWTGLLVEMDPYFYTQLIGKNRKAYSINACLSPTGQVTIVRIPRRKNRISNQHNDNDFVISIFTLHRNKLPEAPVLQCTD